MRILHTSWFSHSFFMNTLKTSRGPRWAKNRHSELFISARSSLGGVLMRSRKQRKSPHHVSEMWEIKSCRAADMTDIFFFFFLQRTPERNSLKFWGCNTCPRDQNTAHTAAGGGWGAALSCLSCFIEIVAATQRRERECVCVSPSPPSSYRRRDAPGVSPRSPSARPAAAAPVWPPARDRQQNTHRGVRHSRKRATKKKKAQS